MINTTKDKTTGITTKEFELTHREAPAYTATANKTEKFTATQSTFVIKEDCNHQMAHMASKYPKPPTQKIANSTNLSKNSED